MRTEAPDSYYGTEGSLVGRPAYFGLNMTPHPAGIAE